MTSTKTERTDYIAGLRAYQNDETFGRLTPEERYDRTLAWLDEQLSPSGVTEC